MQTLLQNLRFSLRMLAKNPGLTITVLLTLALGIGANTAIFTVDYATLLAPMPYPEPDQLVMVWSKIKTYHNSVSAGDFTDWKRQSTAFQDLNAWSGSRFNIATKDQPELIQGRLATTGWFQMMGQAFTLGRGFLPEEGQEGKNHVVVLTHKLWLKLGANPHIIGTTMPMDGEPYTVVGVLAPGPDDRNDAQLTVPLGLQARPGESRLPLAAGHGPIEARRHHQAGAGRYGRGHHPHRRAISEERQRLGCLGRAAAKTTSCPRSESRPSGCC